MDADSIAARTGDAEEFEGVYVAHWEAARFAVQVGTGLFGRPKIENWQAVFPMAFKFPHAVDRHAPRRTYRMRVRGRLGPSGHFGHMGICTRQLNVTDVLTCDENSSPGSTR